MCERRNLFIVGLYTNGRFLDFGHLWGILHCGHQWLILANFGFWSLVADCGFWTLVANFGFWIVLANFGHSWQISFFNLQYFSGNFSQTAFGGSQRFESCRYPKFRNFSK